MSLTRAEFDSAFPRESEYIERKKGLGGGPIQEAVVAFSNNDGGVILIGVADDGAVTGRELIPGVEDAIHEIIRNVHDPGRYRIGSVVVDGIPVTVLSISPRVEGFAQTSNGRVVVRRGTLKVALMGDDLRRAGFRGDRVWWFPLFI